MCPIKAGPFKGSQFKVSSFKNFLFVFSPFEVISCEISLFKVGPFVARLF